MFVTDNCRKMDRNQLVSILCRRLGGDWNEPKENLEILHNAIQQLNEQDCQQLNTALRKGDVLYDLPRQLPRQLDIPVLTVLRKWSPPTPGIPVTETELPFPVREMWDPPQPNH